ncbi:hypothetical protein RFI_12101 [Reticulomyxa filosa]|uniref:Uncharacterized protein n=1 Tax=Reticulomyxa filosa TaxID=46433 RepID=X6NFF0_RETFI|nr:hypothetical protein RFI_12101 [Reticulomyxa filosa]|eukprot:ETO25045.1 hypothetical protein RFI_12101 [Reticulomyxa filosa]
MQVESLAGSSSSRHRQERKNHNLALPQRYLWKKLKISKERQEDLQKEKTLITSNKTKGIYRYTFDMEKVQMIYHEKARMIKVYKDWRDKETTSVVLCSYRNDQCKNILINMFEQAKHFSATQLLGYDCMDFDKILDCDMLPDDPLHPLCGRSWQIKIDCISYEHAKGSMYGRYRAEQFYAVEDYALQIDTHSLFVTDWDNIAIDMFKRKHKDFAIPKPRAMAWCNVDPPFVQT